MTWLEAEEKRLVLDSRRAPGDQRKMVLLGVLVVIVGWLNLAHGLEYVQCPHCDAVLEIEIETTARKIPGAGYECDGCGMFYVHGDKCPWCGRRKK